jgi:hypothetical protein
VDDVRRIDRDVVATQFKEVRGIARAATSQPERGLVQEREAQRPIGADATE